MNWDGKTSLRSAEKPVGKGAYEYVAEYLTLAMITVSCVQVWAILDIKESIKAHDKVTETLTRMTNASSLVIERSLAHLEERQAARAAAEYQLRTAPPGSVPPVDSDNSSPHP